MGPGVGGGGTRTICLQIFKSTLKNNQAKVTLEISSNYNSYVSVQIWRETTAQTEKLCKLIIISVTVEFI